MRRLVAITSVLLPIVANGQLRLAAARDAALSSSPELRAARASIHASAARERYARTWLNPTLAYGREQTSRNGQTNAQDIAQLEQPLEIGGQRTARGDVARVQREIAEVQVRTISAQIELDVARAFALAIAADQRAAVAEQTAAAFSEALRVSEQRLVAGDVSGYVARRLRLEVARFAALRAAGALERRNARTALTTLMGLSATTADSLTLPAELPAMPAVDSGGGLDSLVQRAYLRRPEVRAADLQVQLAAADARLTKAERLPVPTLSAGYKGERVADPTVGSITGFRGIVAGFSVPLPLFDRRAGAIAAAAADTRRFEAEADVVRRRVAQDVSEAFDAVRAVARQEAVLAPHLGEGARIAIRAVQTSYAEGEITLVEWLDAIRAYQEAESTWLSLRAELVVRQAALMRATGTPFPSSVPPNQ